MEVNMANDTKERILAAALEMFSQNGYAGTNIRELSASLGLVKSGVAATHCGHRDSVGNPETVGCNHPSRMPEPSLLGRSD